MCRIAWNKNSEFIQNDCVGRLCTHCLAQDPLSLTNKPTTYLTTELSLKEFRGKCSTQDFPLVPIQDFSLKALDDSGTESIENTGLQYMTILLILDVWFLVLSLARDGNPSG